MGCITTYRGKQYSEQEFEKYIRRNPSEFSNIIPLTSEQVKNIQDLKNIEPSYNIFLNSEIQYAIEQLIPDSQVKEVVFHGSKQVKEVIDKGFDKNKIGTGESTSLQGKGFYLQNINKY